MFIGISGLIGVGKSTLTESLSMALNYRAFYEPVKENAYLDDFYKEPARYGAMMQLYLLNKRFVQHQEAIWNSQTYAGVVQDRTIYEDTIFAKILHNDGLIDDRDYKVYTDAFNIMKRYLVYPDLIIHLDVRPEIALERINKRSRSAESTIELSYLQKLHCGYQQFIDEISRYVDIMVVDYNEYKELDYILQHISPIRTSEYSRSLLAI
jgi:deoxyadenosine kinase